MKFLSLDNILLLRRVIGIVNPKGDDQLTPENVQKLATTMTFLNKYESRISIKTLNKLVIYMYKKYNQSTKSLSPIETMDIPEELKRAYTQSLSSTFEARSMQPINVDINYLQDLYQGAHDFYQTYVKTIPEGQRHEADFMIDKTKQMKDFEKQLFSHITQTTYLTIDSRDRDYDHQSAGSYRIFLKRPLKGIYHLELTSAEVPKSSYQVNVYNNILHFQETNNQVATKTYYQATIPEGNYSITTLLITLQAQMNSVGSSSYTVVLINDRVKITSDLTGGDNIFRIGLVGTNNERYRSETIGRLLGYQPLDLSNAAAYTATNKYDLNYNHFALLSLDNVTRNSSQLCGFFQKIMLDGDITYFGEDKDYRLVHEFYPPLELDYLDISWRDVDGNTLNFNGLEHSITLKVEMFGS